MADNSSKISDLEEILDAGAKSVAVDGRSSQFDHRDLKSRRNELSRVDDAVANRKRKPRFATINMKNAFCYLVGVGVYLFA